MVERAVRAGASSPHCCTAVHGNASLAPEESKSYTLGAVYSPSWAEDTSWSSKLDFELGYYHHKIDGAIQAPDIQGLLDGCVAAASTAGPCAGFTRQGSGNLNPPLNLLDNLGNIKTDGVDIKVNWISPEWGVGRFNASLQSTFVNDYEAVDKFGNVSPRAVGVELNDSAIPEWQTNLQLGWSTGSWSANWNVRYISEVTESCSDFRDDTPNSFANLGLCSDPDLVANGNSLNKLDATWYHDVQVSWKSAFTLDGLKLSAGVNNLFSEDPPICLTCSLNGYDAGTYDLPGQFWYVSADYRF